MHATVTPHLFIQLVKSPGSVYNITYSRFRISVSLSPLLCLIPPALFVLFLIIVILLASQMLLVIIICLVLVTVNIIHLTTMPLLV